jgi:hypothetical protein
MRNENLDFSPPEADPQDGAESISARIVQIGDCCHSLAEASGHVWKKVWSANDGIQSSRQPNQLAPGDRIHIPPIEPKYVEKPTDRRHTFVRTGMVVRLRLRLVRGGRPLVNESYLLRVGFRTFRGRTDGDGIFDQLVPAGETEAILEVPHFSMQAGIRIGALPPSGTTPGIQARLRNLGYGCDLTGENNGSTSGALKSFQSDQRLDPSGNPDSETKSALVREHGV